MTARASTFVHDWMGRNLARDPGSTPSESIEELLERCLDDAAAIGIRPEEIAEEIGDLKSFIKEALEDTADEEGEESDPWEDV